MPPLDTPPDENTKTLRPPRFPPPVDHRELRSRGLRPPIHRHTTHPT
jgi:hypothetical protein